MIDMRGDLGRIHGSVGVAIDNPSIVLKAKEASSIDVKGPRAVSYTHLTLPTSDLV